MTTPTFRTSTADALSPVDALAQLAFLVLGTLERRAAEQHVSMAQTRLLGVLRDRRPGMNELAALLDLDKSSVTGLVDRAERRGLVERTPSSTDGRSVQVRLTRKGRSVVSAVADRFEADVTELLAHLPAKDRQALTGAAGRLLTSHAVAHGIDLFPG